MFFFYCLCSKAAQPATPVFPVFNIIHRVFLAIFFTDFHTHGSFLTTSLSCHPADKPFTMIFTSLLLTYIGLPPKYKETESTRMIHSHFFFTIKSTIAIFFFQDDKQYERKIKHKKMKASLPTCKLANAHTQKQVSAKNTLSCQTVTVHGVIAQTKQMTYESVIKFTHLTQSVTDIGFDMYIIFTFMHPYGGPTKNTLSLPLTHTDALFFLLYTICI